MNLTNREAICIVKNDWTDPLRFQVMFGTRYKNMLAVAKPVEMISIPEGEPAPPEPMLALERNEIQAFMDAMWNAGIRPSDIGTPGHLAATQKHLDDMRKLVSHLTQAAL